MKAATLSADQRRTYERDGYVVLPDVFGQTELATMRAEADRLADWQVNASLALGRLSPRCDIRTGTDGPVLLKLQPLSDVSDVFASVAADDRLLDPMRALLGCEPLLLEEKLNGKETLRPVAASLPLRDWEPAFPFHTDLHYFVLDGYPEKSLSSAVALDDCTSDSGPLRFVPGSHLRKDWPIQTEWPPILAEGACRDEDAVPLICPAGTVVIFHSRIVHASSPNRSGRPRRLLIYSHFPETHQVEPDARNRDLRRAAQAFEAEYRRALEGGYRPIAVRAR